MEGIAIFLSDLKVGKKREVMQKAGIQEDEAYQHDLLPLVVVSHPEKIKIL